MTKLLLGVAIGYLLSDVIDQFLGKEAPEKPSPKEDPPPTPDETVLT